MTHLQEGDKAPAFSGKDANGKKISLADFKGKRVVLYFYPQDDTPTCTVQACNLRDNNALLRAAGFSVLGVSPDDQKSHLNLKQNLTCPFHLSPTRIMSSSTNTGSGVKNSYMAGSISDYIVPPS